MKTKIFISSTCYDLSVIRENLNGLILDLGHQPLLSEYSSFPVDPSTLNLDNCKNNIKLHTDILVLIIGGKRGSLDEDSKKSITNLEYEAARQIGLPIFIFVSAEVRNLIPIWKNNPDANFNPIVDKPEVFQFIQRIQDENKWIFSFHKFHDIKDILSNQLSYLFKSLIDKSKDRKLPQADIFASECDEAKQIAVNKPNLWEFRLTQSLLTAKLSTIDAKFNDITKGLVFQKARSMKSKELLDHIVSKQADLIALVNLTDAVLKEIVASWGPSGTPGDEKQILLGVNRLISICLQLVDWELDLIGLHPRDELVPLKETLKGWTNVLYLEIKRIPEELKKACDSYSNGATHYNIDLKLNSPPVDLFCKELDRLRVTQLHLFRS